MGISGRGFTWRLHIAASHGGFTRSQINGSKLQDLNLQLKNTYPGALDRTPTLSSTPSTTLIISPEPLHRPLVNFHQGRPNLPSPVPVHHPHQRRVSNSNKENALIASLSAFSRPYPQSLPAWYDEPVHPPGLHSLNSCALVT